MDAVLESWARYSVDWLTLAFINAALAKSMNGKGGNGLGGLGWFVISLFIGPGATILIAVFKTVEPSKQ